MDHKLISLTLYMYLFLSYLFSTQVRGMATLKESKYFVLIVMVAVITCQTEQYLVEWSCINLFLNPKQ